jgi:hypothetical protein
MQHRLSTECHGRVVNTLLPIQEIPVSNLDPEIGYPDRGICGSP